MKERKNGNRNRSGHKIFMACFQLAKIVLISDNTEKGKILAGRPKIP